MALLGFSYSAASTKQIDLVDVILWAWGSHGDLASVSRLLYSEEVLAAGVPARLMFLCRIISTRTGDLQVATSNALRAFVDCK